MSDSIHITWAALLTAFVVLVTVFGLQGCAVAVQESPECAAYYQCAANEKSRVECVDGDCFCLAPTHPGQNAVERCVTGEPDQSREPVDPWASKATH